MGPNTGGSSSVGVGVSKAIKSALTELHSSDKTVENTDQLMVSFVLWCLDCFIVEWILTAAAVKGKMEQTIGENDSQNAL